MMINRIRTTFVALIAMAAVVAGGEHLSAQPTFCNPPCAGITVINNHPTCSARPRFRTNPPVVWPAPIIPPAGGAAFFPIPAGICVQVLGVIDVNNITHPFNPPPPPVVVCGPNAWWALGVPLNGAAVGCNFTVCADPATCTITLW